MTKETANGQTVPAAELAKHMRGLRQRLAARVLVELNGEGTAWTAYLGETYASSDEPEPARQRAAGAAFHFLAFACAPWKMWDFHAGVVPIGETTLSIGLHVSERAAPVLRENLESLAMTAGRHVKHVPQVMEYQMNLAPCDASQAGFASLLENVMHVCRLYSETAAGVACPAELQGGGAD